MTTEVLQLVDELYRTHRTKENVKKAFIDRASDVTFALIGVTACQNNPNPKNPTLHLEFVWLGYEIAIDAVQLADHWK